MDGLVGLYKVFFFVKEVIIPLNPNAPKGKRDDSIPAQPLVEGHIFYTGPCGHPVISVENIGIKVMDARALAG